MNTLIDKLVFLTIAETERKNKRGESNKLDITYVVVQELWWILRVQNTGLFAHLLNVLSLDSQFAFWLFDLGLGLTKSRVLIENFMHIRTAAWCHFCFTCNLFYFFYSFINMTIVEITWHKWLNCFIIKHGVFKMERSRFKFRWQTKISFKK